MLLSECDDSCPSRLPFCVAQRRWKERKGKGGGEGGKGGRAREGGRQARASLRVNGDIPILPRQVRNSLQCVLPYRCGNAIPRRSTSTRTAHLYGGSLQSKENVVIQCTIILVNLFLTITGNFRSW